MPIATPQGTLDFKSVDKVTFVGASSNTVIDTTTGSLGVGVGVGGPTSNLHVVGNAYVSSNLTISGFVGSSGTGALTVPSGTTAEQPTGVAGMIRYNSTLNKYEGRVSTIWMPMTGDPPLYEFISHTFTNAGATGNNGPEIADLTTSYSPTWTDNTNYLNMVTRG